MACKVKRFKKTRVCTGDLDKLIDIQTRVLVPPGPGVNEAREEFVTVLQVWAAVENSQAAVRGVATFDDINVENNPTDVWYIRYDPDLSLETGNRFILHSGRRYRILSVKNDNRDNGILILLTRETGASAQLPAGA